METTPPTKSIEPYSIEELQSMQEEDFHALDRSRLMITSPVDVARMIERFETDQQRQVMRLITTNQAAEVISEFRPEDSAELIGKMRPERAVEILRHFDPDDATDIIAELGDADRSRILGDLEPDQVETVTRLLSYPEDSAGGIMTTEFAFIEPHIHVDEAIGRIRKQNEELETIYYIYVVDQGKRLVGVISMRDLILARPDDLVQGIMKTDLYGKVDPDTDREQVAHLVAEYNLLAVPVVDESGRILGIVTHDDVLDVVQKEATEDLQKLVGAGADESIHSKLSYSLRKRGPWLQVNLATAFLASTVVYFFRHQIEQMSILAVFMPIVASMGGNAGTQTLVVAIRSIAVGEVQSSDQLWICLKESILGILNGIATGLAAAAAAYILLNDLGIAVVVFVAMVLTMVLAGAAGALIPISLKRVGLDPAQSSSIFLTTVTDVAGFFIFLSLGSAFLLS
jgi:magnesium transporter